MVTERVRVRIIVPCYNEANRLPVAAFNEYLAAAAAAGAPNADVGFLFVNDGSTDTTMQRLLELGERFPRRVRVLDQQPNVGKAEAVRAGVLAALAEEGLSYVGYFDADLATPLAEVANFVAVLDQEPGIDIVLGARVALLGRRIARKPARHYLGRVFATAASMVLGLPVYDTQCGAKLLRVTDTTRELFARPFGSRWIFDVELLARFLTCAQDAKRIYELPLRSWTDVGESKVRPRDFLRAGGEMLAIYRQYRLPPPRALLSVLAAPIVRYVGAGGIGTLAHYATLALMVESTGMPPSSATVVGALVGALINYLLNYHFTFASHASHRKTLPKFMVVAAISAALNGAVLHLSTRELDVHYLVAQLASTFIVLILGFVLNRLWTFRDSAPALAHAVSVTPPAAQLAGERGAREPAEDNRPFEENPPSAGSWAP